MPIQGEILTPEALSFVRALEERFGPVRNRLLADRKRRQDRYDAGEMPAFLLQTEDVRGADWMVAPVPKDLEDRRVELTGPVERKLMINALNSGASVFMADFEDSTSPTWHNIIDGQINLYDAVRGTIAHDSPDGRRYELGGETAVLVVRPRGWHLPERHLQLAGRPVSASLFDFGLYFFHNARELADRGTGPYFYLPKLESYLEARLWNDVFCFAQDDMGLPRGTIKATVLVETLPAAFEMEEILWELREHSAGLNAGRWDYIFSTIKKLRNNYTQVLPDRGDITMTVPFMRAYTELLVKTCHRRGAHAIGGMAAFIPNRSNPEANEAALAKVSADKIREAGDGFDGTWVAHPDLVPVAGQVFDQVLSDRPNQIERQREDVDVNEADLLQLDVPDGRITENGLRTNIRVAVAYLESWLGGTGAAALFDLMEDTATAEISRSQVWQWLNHGAGLDDGRKVDRPLVREVIADELSEMRAPFGEDTHGARRFVQACRLFEKVALSEDFVEFLTIPGYELLD